MRVLSFAAVLLVASVAPASALVAPEAPWTNDADGARSLDALIHDGAGGTWREIPLSDEGIAAFSDVLAGVAIDPVVFAAELQGAGAYVHAWTLDGSPYATLGAYVDTTTAGKVRMPVAIVENATDLEDVAMLAVSLVADDAMPIAAESFPHVYGLAAPDVIMVGTLAGVSAALLTAVGLGIANAVEEVDGSTTAVNAPPEAYAAAQKLGFSLVELSLPLIYGQYGIGGVYFEDASWPEDENFTRDWAERPDVRIWLTRKVGFGAEVWTGLSVTREGGATGNGVNDFHAWKRVAIGPVARIDRELVAPSAIYLRADTSRYYQDNAPEGQGPTRIENRYVLTAGVHAAGADRPLASAQMNEWRNDSHDESWTGHETDSAMGVDVVEATMWPESQESRWSAGPVVDGEYQPLVGARTRSSHRGHNDTTNLGRPVFEVESERLSSAGVFVDGEYVPLVGARTWTERWTPEFWAPFLAGEGVGSQDAGDGEASVGTFSGGVYLPLAGARYDDDFPGRHHAYRGLASAGPYVDGVYQPIVGTTYDGAVEFSTWIGERAAGGAGGERAWQSSVGTFTPGQYRPIVGTRYVPAATGAPEKHEAGVYALSYAAFVPIASIPGSER